jgi:predicted amidohydrolase
MDVALIQPAFDAGDSTERRIDHVLALFEQARDADLVMLPELWPVGYFNFDRYAQAAEPVHGATMGRLSEAAQDIRAYVHAGSIVEATPDGELYNTSVLITPIGRVLHTYRKLHLFSLESQEADLLTPGVQVRVVPTVLGRLAMTTCYDLRFPELYRLLSDAEVVLVTAAWPAARAEHWRVLTRARAIENLVYVIACNQAGECNGVRLAGRSVVVDPRGELVAEAGAGEEVLHATIDVSAVEKARAEFPVLDDRRIDVGGRA